jgi:hypothetical protein
MDYLLSYQSVRISSWLTGHSGHGKGRRPMPTTKKIKEWGNYHLYSIIRITTCRHFCWWWAGVQPESCFWWGTRIDLATLYHSSPTSTEATANHHRLHARWRFELVTENTLFQRLRDWSLLNQKYDNWTPFVFNWCLTSSQCCADVVLPDTSVRRSGMGVLGTTCMVLGWVEHQPTVLDDHRARPKRNHRWLLLHSHIRLSSLKLRLIENRQKRSLTLEPQFPNQ